MQELVKKEISGDMFVGSGFETIQQFSNNYMSDIIDDATFRFLESKGYEPKMTREFFTSVREELKTRGLALFNYITLDPSEAVTKTEEGYTLNYLVFVDIIPIEELSTCLQFMRLWKDSRLWGIDNDYQTLKDDRLKELGTNVRSYKRKP